jgi:hypothetical protein
MILKGLSKLGEKEPSVILFQICAELGICQQSSLIPKPVDRRPCTVYLGKEERVRKEMSKYHYR